MITDRFLLEGHVALVTGVIMALGIHGQTLYIDPEREFVVAKFSSQPDQANISMALDQMLAFEAIATMLAE